MKQFDNFNRKKGLMYNTVSSLIFQIVTVICGFILPRLILQEYGSSINGLLNSITQFLGIIAFMELGVGAVVQSALYEPLANKDLVSVSRIIVSADRFYKKIGILLILYTLFLMVFLPNILSNSFERWFISIMIAVMFLNSFVQYYFGIVDRLLLSADQRGYIQHAVQIPACLLNTLACYILIKIRANIVFVKFCTSFIFLMQPFILRIIINKLFRIDRCISYKSEPIKQKWNGLAQHIAAIGLDSTDILVLTVLSTLENVSIYSVYNLVIYGIRNIFVVLTSGIQSYWGNMWVKREFEELKESFSYYEWLIHMGVVLIFGCTGALIVPFVQIYTRDINDTNYIVPIFAIVLTIAHGCRCLRLPYDILIKSVGHYKETQWNYVIAVIINVTISIVTVKIYGLIGVAIGTLIAMIYQTLWMAWYDRIKVISLPITSFKKLIFVDIICIIIGWWGSILISFEINSYIDWFLLASIKFVFWSIIVSFVNIFVYKNYIISLLRNFNIRYKSE